MTTRRTRADWRQLLARQARSGLSIAAFARREGIRPQSLHWWRWKLRETNAPLPSSTGSVSPGFVQLDLRHPTSDGDAGAFEIAMPGDVVIRVPRGFDTRELRAILETVRASC